MNTKETKAVLYSVSQGCFHLETLEDYIKTNSENCLRGKSSDYQLIAVFDNDVEADMYIRRFKTWLGIINRTDNITSSQNN